MQLGWPLSRAVVTRPLPNWWGPRPGSAAALAAAARRMDRDIVASPSPDDAAAPTGHRRPPTTPDAPTPARAPPPQPHRDRSRGVREDYGDGDGGRLPADVAMTDSAAAGLLSLRYKRAPPASVGRGGPAERQTQRGAAPHRARSRTPGRDMCLEALQQYALLRERGVAGARTDGAMLGILCHWRQAGYVELFVRKYLDGDGEGGGGARWTPDLLTTLISHYAKAKDITTCRMLWARAMPLCNNMPPIPLVAAMAAALASNGDVPGGREVFLWGKRAVEGAVAAGTGAQASSQERAETVGPSPHAARSSPHDADGGAAALAADGWTEKAAAAPPQLPPPTRKELLAFYNTGIRVMAGVREADALLREMTGRQGLQADAYTLTNLITVCRAAADPGAARRYCDELRAVVNPVHWNALLAMYGDLGDTTTYLNILAHLRKHRLANERTLLAALQTLAGGVEAVARGDEWGDGGASPRADDPRATRCSDPEASREEGDAVGNARAPSSKTTRRAGDGILADLVAVAEAVFDDATSSLPLSVNPRCYHCMLRIYAAINRPDRADRVMQRMQRHRVQPTAAAAETIRALFGHSISHNSGGSSVQDYRLGARATTR